MINKGYMPDRSSGNGSTTVFPYNFKIDAEEDLKVIIADANDNQTVLVLNTDYTVTGVGNDNGGNIAYPISGDPLPSGWSITRKRVVDVEQQTDFANQGGFFAETHEDSFDYLTMIAQQQAEELNRCVKVSETSGLDGDSFLTDLNTAVGNAQTAATNAQTAETNAETAETNAETAQTAAEAAQTAAESAQTAAEAARDLAQDYANDITINTHEETASASQSTVTISGFILASSLDNIEVFIDGVKQAKSTLTRTSDTVLTLGGALVGGEKIELRSAAFSPTATADAAASASAASTSASNAATSETNAAASAASLNLPVIQIGDAGKCLAVKAAEDGYELVGAPNIYGEYFGNADVVSGVLRVTHSLNTMFCTVVVTDMYKKQIIPDEITMSGIDVLDIDLSSYGNISGIWRVMVTGYIQ